MTGRNARLRAKFAARFFIGCKDGQSKLYLAPVGVLGGSVEVKIVMPHMTYAYPFERMVLGFAARLSATLAGDDGRASFAAVFDDRGRVHALQFECSADLHELTRRYDEARVAYLLYDPFELDYTFMKWSHVDQSTMERLIGHRFADIDFVKDLHAARRAPDLQPQGTYPGSWQVMF